MDDRTPGAAGSLDQTLEQAVDRAFLLRLRTRPTEVAEWLKLGEPIRFRPAIKRHPSARRSTS